MGWAALIAVASPVATTGARIYRVPAVGIVRKGFVRRLVGGIPGAWQAVPTHTGVSVPSV